MTFDRFLMVDWSGGNDTGPTPRKDAIWIGEDGDTPRYLRNRALAEDVIAGTIEQALSDGQRLMIGFDFPFGYPQGFAGALTGRDDPFAVWSWLAERIEDAPKANNRFDVAGEINRALGAGRGPFWANGLQRDIGGLPRTKGDYHNPFPERRACEVVARGAFSCWQLAGAGAVGSQVLMGLPVLHRLRARFGERVAVWPFEPLDAPVAFVEIWPSLLNDMVKDAEAGGGIRDAHQVRLVADVVAAMPGEDLRRLLDVEAPEEGWIFGLGHEETLRAGARRVVPPLRNDCFALPPGVDWTPVDDALALLRERLSPVVARETVPLALASGRVLAEPVVARRSNPPHPNTAVDGYGFAGGAGEGIQMLRLVEGRAAAGAPFAGRVGEGEAVRVLTGADLPQGVDTVVLDEDVVLRDGMVGFHGPLKAGANTRRAGEDVAAGDVALAAGRVLTPADLALASAVGYGALPVFRPLRVAVLSTGDELAEAGSDAGPGQIFDANRPMLVAMAERWGYQAVDMGRVPDDRAELRARLSNAASRADVILTSGGASAGDEDHVSALLREAGAMQEWRIALKPGRPLALGLWDGVPVFGLPGNPVAAMVCTLVFARPAMGILSGAGWKEAQGFDVPAGFEKSKKPGRREFLRARLRAGRAEVFKSEGSGRISGLSWAEGLVELPDGACTVTHGDPVRFIPFGSFGL